MSYILQGDSEQHWTTITSCESGTALLLCLSSLRTHHRVARYSRERAVPAHMNSTLPFDNACARECLCGAAVPLAQLSGDTADFVKVNVDQSGFYRVQYSGDLWHANARAAGASQTNLSQGDVAGLLDNAYTLHQMEGAINITVWLELLQ